ncbi:MAG: type II toxin-antitoxin system HicB family antitoxin [Chloroflexota bacterium]
MRYRLAVEDMEPEHWIAWALDVPGCFSSARTQEEAVANAPARIAEHFTWLTKHGRPASAPDSIETAVAEVFHSFPSKEDPEYMVSAFFGDDRRPLTADDVDYGLWLLDCTRRDLMDAVTALPPDQLDRPAVAPKEFETVPGILNHIAIAEWWYFDRLDMALVSNWRQLPADPLTKLEQVRTHSRACLPKLISDTQIVTLVDEAWSARKVLRRTLWHERDHTQQIAKLTHDSS